LSPLRIAGRFASRLAESDIADICELRREGMTIQELGRWYGVHHSTISRICTRASWTHVP
jgi:IS30 family transposase